MNKAALTQKMIVDNYFAHLQNYGYLRDEMAQQIFLAVSLLGSLEFFKEFVDDEYRADVCRILRNLNCCNCLITVDKYDPAPMQPFYSFIPKETSEVEQGESLIFK